MTKLRDLEAMLLKDPQVRREYDALEEEFALILEVTKARQRARLGWPEVARRMKASQSTIARLENETSALDAHARPLRKGDRASAEDQL